MCVMQVQGIEYINCCANRVENEKSFFYDVTSAVSLFLVAPQAMNPTKLAIEDCRLPDT